MMPTSSTVVLARPFLGSPIHGHDLDPDGTTAVGPMSPPKAPDSAIKVFHVWVSTIAVLGGMFVIARTEVRQQSEAALVQAEQQGAALAVLTGLRRDLSAVVTQVETNTKAVQAALEVDAAQERKLIAIAAALDVEFEPVQPRRRRAAPQPVGPLHGIQ